LQERKILQNENAELKRRLHKAEHDLLNAKEECLHLTNNASALEREVLFSVTVLLCIHWFDFVNVEIIVSYMWM
jgi:hypothetical protein